MADAPVVVLNKSLIAALMMAAAISASQALGADGPPPNVVLILTDDLGVHDLGCYGRSEHSTPHLDRLAAEGMRFTQAYASAPLCSAARASLLTGKHPARLHLTSYLPGRADGPSQRLLPPRQEGQLPLEEVTLAEVLRPAGYATACLGKWHLGGAGFGPAAQGFETVSPGAPTTTPTSTEGSKGEMALAAKADAFIAAHRDRPFFLLLSHDTPHIPFQATADAQARHADTFNPTYAAVIESLDASVGKVLNSLDAHGVAERTLVIFASDNGGLHVPELGLEPPTHNSPWRAGKGFLYEGGIRIPLIVRWPGVTPPASTQTVPVILTDIMPSVMEAAGLAPSKVTGPLDGISLLPMLKPSPAARPAERPLFWHFPHYSNQGGRPASALREGRWKAIEEHESGTTAVYNLEADPGESHDLAAADPDRARAMARRLAEWRHAVGAQMPRPNPEFSAAAAAPIYRETDVSRPPPPTTAAELGRAWAPWRAAIDAAAAGRKALVTPPRGDIRLHARAAQIHGSHLRYEPEPWKNTLGYWVNVGDWAEWEFTAPAAGRYEVEIQQACGADQGGSDVDLIVGGQSLAFTVRETGHFQQFISLTLGEVDLPAGTHSLTLRPRRKARDAIMDVRRVVLRPAVVEPAP